MGKREDYYKPQYYINRELSWVKFNERCLLEARDKENPFFERIKFLSITASNLDEFFMVRVASLKDMIHAGYSKTDIAGLSPAKQLDELSRVLHQFVSMQYDTYTNMIIPGFEQNKIKVIEHYEDLNEKQSEFICKYFEKNVYPVLTPMAVDSSRPFPLIKNKTLNIGALLKKKEGVDGKAKSKNKDVHFATVQVPSVLPRLIQIPDNEYTVIIRLEEVIEMNISKLFLSNDVICSAPYRIMRNADLTIEEEEAEDLLKEIEKQIKMRQWGETIRLEVESGADKKLVEFLMTEFNISDDDMYDITGPIDLTFLMKMYALEGFDDLKKKAYVPATNPSIPAGSNIFDCIKKNDILLHHPYESFNPVVDFITQAANDENVLAIKQTLYRVSGNSPIIQALSLAAENGKQVSVLVELKARFDEENNIVWAKMLEKAGCHVIYGLVGLKTHSKITLVVRREKDGIRRYVHLGTGNYNDATAKLYTDFGLLTAAETIGEDATAVFNMLSGYSEPLMWNKLILAPLWLKNRLIKLIERETENARKNRKAKIMAKMNSICDPDVIAALYEASSAGVEIKLLVRGICCLRPGVKGVSENITVRSIVGDYLEHGRVFYFENDLSPEIYLSSADWMPRNLERRVEIMFPIENDYIRDKIKDILDIQFSDNVKTHILDLDGNYTKIKRKKGENAICCHDLFCKMAKDAMQKNSKAPNKGERVFVPKTKA